MSKSQQSVPKLLFDRSERWINTGKDQDEYYPRIVGRSVIEAFGETLRRNERSYASWTEYPFCLGRQT